MGEINFSKIFGRMFDTVSARNTGRHRLEQGRGRKGTKNKMQPRNKAKARMAKLARRRNR